ncbi:MAG TPA: hypothetical protein VHT92_08875 [Candidatus Cybelea sp.]|jgi:hypothetical protein|nr:hypothetical protein [Candidatus Cybelea sp.]
MPALARLIPIAAAAIFTAFVVVKGVPTLRHDWAWPIDRTAVASFLGESLNGWLSSGFGTPNPHPTTYLIGPPIAAAMWLFGTLAALALFAAAIGYACMRTVAAAAAHFGASATAASGVGLFALFNPWVYNEIVAGHLVMVLAYAGFIGLCAEMLRGRDASSVRLALWIALIEAQLQFYIVAMLALAAFAVATRKWQPAVFGAIFALPSIAGLVFERATLLRIPYVVEWQANQSVSPLPLLALGGYFPGYADRLGVAASVAVWLVLALALAGLVAGLRSRAVVTIALAAAIVFVATLGVHGPLAGAYTWIVRNVPESGVFRELYDLAGIFAAAIVLLACAACARIRRLEYVALAAGVALTVTWLIRPPSDLWVASAAYPHPAVAAPPFTRIALLPAFQPLALRGGEGGGADPDAYVRPGGIASVNEYFPTYPVDMALARYEQSADVVPLRALGVSEIVPRPWLVSKVHGGIGLAATSLAPRLPGRALAAAQSVDGAMPLMSECPALTLTSLTWRLDACALFFGDAPGYAPVRPIIAPSDSIDPQTAWIDARLAFPENPALAQGIGGALTQSVSPLPVESNAWLLAFVRGSLRAPDGRVLASNDGAFAWLWIPRGVFSVECAGLCELVAQTAQLPHVPPSTAPAQGRAFAFRRILSWLYVVDATGDDGAHSQRLTPAILRFNERYDPGWLAFASGRVLRHVRVDLSVNGWFLGTLPQTVVLVQATAVVQAIAEFVAILFALALLKALVRAPTKRT